MTSYQEALALLEYSSKFGIAPTLEGATILTRWIGDPQLSYPCVQIAGTNGKSSTSRFIAAFLHSQKKKVGLYTSPELVEHPERMEIDNTVVSRERFALAVFKAHEAALKAIAAGEILSATQFELFTAAALWLFAEEKVDFAVLEAGLGGRWDATSVATPKVAVITGVGLDHTELLGDTVEKIAVEKAAIIKSGCIPILGPGTAETRSAFLERCEEVGVTPIIVEPDDYLDGYGLSFSRYPSYQKQNIACALAATQAALGQPLDFSAIQHVLDTLTIPGRFELLRQQPPLLIDASHNPQSAQVLAQVLRENQGFDEISGRIRGFDTLLLGVLVEKDAEGIISILTPLFENLVVTQSHSPRAISAEALADRVRQTTGRKPEVFPTVAAALGELTRREAAVVATGSITLAGDVKRVWCDL